MTVEWWSIAISGFLTIVVGLLGWVSHKQERTQDRLHERLDENDDTTREQGMRITTLEEHIKHLPTAESIGRLHEKVNDVNSRIAEVKGGQDVMTKLLSELLRDNRADHRPR